MAKPLVLSTPTCFRSIRPLYIFFLTLVLGALACNLSDLTGDTKPIAIISSPPSGSAFREGDDVAVESVSTDARGVVRVELVVDGQIVLADTTSTPQNRLVLVQV